MLKIKPQGQWKCKAVPLLGATETAVEWILVTCIVVQNIVYLLLLLEVV